jgi:hypothetical protein
MAALLMPRSIFSNEARQRRAAGDNEAALTVDMSMLFAVSKQAARIRLQSLGFFEPDGTYATALLN